MGSWGGMLRRERPGYRACHRPVGSSTECGALLEFLLVTRWNRSPGPVAHVQFQFVQRAATVEEAGAATVATEIGYTDEMVFVVKHYTEIRGRPIRIAASCWIPCTESVQNLEFIVIPDKVNDAVAIQPPETKPLSTASHLPRVSAGQTDSPRPSSHPLRLRR